MTRFEKIRNSSNIHGISAMHDPSELETIEFQTDCKYEQDSLGLRFSGNRSVGVFINGVLNGGLACSTGKVHSGDQLIRIDDFCLAGHTPDQAVRVLRSFLANKGSVKLTLAHSWSERSCKPSTSKLDSSKHLAADNSVPLSKSDSKLTTNGHNAMQYNDAGLRSPKDRSTTLTSSLAPRPTATLGVAVAVVHVSASSSPRSLIGDDADDSRSRAHTLASASTIDVNRLSPLDWDIASLKRGKSEGDLIAPSISPIGQILFSSKRAVSITSDDAPSIAPAAYYSLADSDAVFKGSSFIESERCAFRRTASSNGLQMVSFSQLNRSASSTHQQAEKTETRNSSSQSKSSKGSNKSSRSQELSWHCPVCLDGANRISRSKRRMMSTVCGHVFCSKCVEDVIGKYKMCPSCRAAISGINDVHPLFM